jgi:hypothetical protein
MKFLLTTPSFPTFQVKKKYGSMPFNLRNFEEEAKAKMGVVECVSHKLIEPFQVLYEKNNEYVAQFKFTVLLLPNGVNLITGLPLEQSFYDSEHSVTADDLKELLATELKLTEEVKLPEAKKPKKPKKKKVAAEGGDGAAAAATNEETAKAAA